jgi:hypothetical protein
MEKSKTANKSANKAVKKSPSKPPTHPLHAQFLSLADANVLGAAPIQHSLQFTLKQTNSRVVQVILDSTEVVMVNSTSRPSMPRAVGSAVGVTVSMQGNPGDTATISITNAIPAQLVVTHGGTGPVSISLLGIQVA